MPTDTEEVKHTESKSNAAPDTYILSLKDEAIKARQKAKTRKTELEAVAKEKAELEKKIAELTKAQGTVNETLAKAKDNIKSVKIDSILAETGLKDPEVLSLIKAGLNSEIKVSDSLELEFQADKINTLVSKLKSVQGSSATPNPANTAPTTVREVISNAAVTAVTQHTNPAPNAPANSILTETASDRLNAALIQALKSANETAS